MPQCFNERKQGNHKREKAKIMRCREEEEEKNR